MRVLAVPGNYLRARGEYCRKLQAWHRTVELPPRTRRIRPRLPARIIAHGTTSAHAENTFQVAADGCHSGNYLRARGEYMPPTPAVTGFLELPPRTRRIPRSVWPMVTTGGTTSAHAENTIDAGRGRPNRGNYLRARGEYLATAYIVSPEQELPPRTRRIRLVETPIHRSIGTTSAHAENTLPQSWGRAHYGNYLRARGEYGDTHLRHVPAQELPPRTRRIRNLRFLQGGTEGTTSAHAENTPCCVMRKLGARNYLRARGEYCAVGRGRKLKMELPPRTRRIRGEGANLNPPIGTTSAHAENTVPWGGDES